MKSFEKKIDRCNVRIDKFSGIDEMINWLERTPADEGFRDTIDGTRGMRKSFHGVESYEQARALFKKGVNVKDVKAAINTGSRDYSKKQNVRHISGGAPCVPAAVASDPRAMYQRRNKQITGAYNVFVNCCYSGMTTSEQVKKAGLKILQEVIRISAIKPVNLYVGNISIDNQQRNVIGYGLQIMDAGKAFNAARVSYALTECGFLRVFGFAHSERNRGMWSSDNDFGMGIVLSAVNPELNRKVLEGAFKNTLFVNISDVICGNKSALRELENIR